jgi:hypothetical protein
MKNALQKGQKAPADSEIFDKPSQGALLENPHKGSEQHTYDLSAANYNNIKT